eukprot:SAG25_NODE_6558_length_551_cov_0.681416_2_plen_71_part_01
MLGWTPPVLERAAAAVVDTVATPRSELSFCRCCPAYGATCGESGARREAAAAAAVAVAIVIAVTESTPVRF